MFHNKTRNLKWLVPIASLQVIAPAKYRSRHVILHQIWPSTRPSSSHRPDMQLFWNILSMIAGMLTFTCLGILFHICFSSFIGSVTLDVLEDRVCSRIFCKIAPVLAFVLTSSSLHARDNVEAPVRPGCFDSVGVRWVFAHLLYSRDHHLAGEENQSLATQGYDYNVNSLTHFLLVVCHERIINIGLCVQSD